MSAMTSPRTSQARAGRHEGHPFVPSARPSVAGRMAPKRFRHSSPCPRFFSPPVDPETIRHKLDQACFKSDRAMGSRLPNCLSAFNPYARVSSVPSGMSAAVC